MKLAYAFLAVGLLLAMPASAATDDASPRKAIRRTPFSPAAVSGAWKPISTRYRACWTPCRAISAASSNPAYEQVSAGGTGHAEVVRVTFNPQTVSYAELLEVFWRSIDPTTVDSQFCDHGDQYRTAIFYTSPEQERAARQSLANLMKAKPFAEPIVTEITPAGVFYPAEDYHQDYYEKNPAPRPGAR
jgi:peptide-methionine (S)-S-oxide reductase